MEYTVEFKYISRVVSFAWLPYLFIATLWCNKLVRFVRLIFVNALRYNLFESCIVPKNIVVHFLMKMMLSANYTLFIGKYPRFFALRLSLFYGGN